MEVELWQLRYVVAVAEEGSFTRAAARLHISQPALSARVRELEQRLGLELFDRSGRTVVATPAGATLADRGRALLADAAAAVAAARNAVAAPVLRVGLLGTAGAVLFGLVAARLEAEGDGAPRLEPRRLGFPDEVEAGEADVAFTRLELDESPLELEVLLRERRVLAVGVTHRLHGAGPVAMSELGDEAFLTQRSPADTRVRERWLDEQRRHGLRGRLAAELVDSEQMFALLEAGRGVCLVPATVARYHARPGVGYVEVRDADTVPVTLAWRAAAEQPALERLRVAARAAAAQLLAQDGQRDWLPAGHGRIGSA